jgi:hypothetical protein
MRLNRRSGGLLLLLLLALAGCGSAVGGIRAPGGDGGPGGGSVGDDAEIIFEDGSSGGGGIDPRCASGSPVGTGQACGPAGLICPLGSLTDCNGNVRTLECTCDGRLWSCPPVTPPVCELPPPPPPTGCPDPSTLLPGSPCSTPENIQCVSTDIPGPNCGDQAPFLTKAECQCFEGAWQCPSNPISCPPPPPPPPTTCPDPSNVYSGESCTTIGGNCSGNPTYCFGAVFYDALTCVSGTWVTVATTVCDGEGAFDAGVEYTDASVATSDGN